MGDLSFFTITNKTQLQSMSVHLFQEWITYTNIHVQLTHTWYTKKYSHTESWTKYFTDRYLFALRKRKLVC